MGSFYTNYTLRGPEPSTVASALTGRRALVSPLCGGCVVVFDEASDDQDLDLISSLAARLSSDLSCQVLSVLNHDDDILWYRLYASGRLSDEYNSSPGYFEPRAKPSSPLGGNAAVLCAAFGSRNVDEVERILRKPAVGIAAYAFAYERHADLAIALSLPSFVVGTRYSSFESEPNPTGLSAADMLKPAGAPLPPSADEKQRRRDLQFYDRLGTEDVSRMCHREGCERGTVKMSNFCRSHHFEMIFRRTCPFHH